jgi:NarL family two-component system sensor histidine kinase LiaS
MILQRIKSSFRRLQWKLTMSYTAVTIGSLLIVILTMGYLLFSRAFIPIDFYESEITPEFWFKTISDNSAPIWRPILSQDPIDLELISALMQESNLTINSNDFFNIGNFQIDLTTFAQGSGYLVGPDGTLLGAYNSKLVTDTDFGKPINYELLPGLETPLRAALNGENDPDELFVTLEQSKHFHFSIPIFDEAGQKILGVAIIYIEHLPTSTDIPQTMWILVGRSVLVLLLAVGLVGTIFGALTASGVVSRLEHVSEATSAWSEGDFTEFIEDPAGDEISTLAERLNHMAKQLQQFLKQSQEMAVSEERNRLARDLHDSAKQEALAASFHLGTALTLFEGDPISAKTHLVEADNLVDSVRRELTDLIHELRPPTINGKQFDETLNEYLIDWAHQTGIEATLNVEGFVDLPLETKQAIYRIMQEGLANVTRHSSAETVEVLLQFETDSVNFCISDDGVGFDLHQPHHGMGLDSMRERVESLQGVFRIESVQDQGTKICISFPIDNGG